MSNYLKNIKKRDIAILFLAFILLIISINLYKSNKSKVFMDEYMEDIFVEEAVATISEEDIIEELPKEKEVKKTIVVEIKGEVRKPDVYEMEEGSIIKDLIDKAGGLTEEANIDKINRAAKLNPNQLIIIPNKNFSEEISLEGASVIYNESNEKLININTASLEELTEIKGIGEVKAKSIIEYREKYGAFKSIEELKNVKGIGEKTFEKLKDLVTI
ncbi:helix-hairpin-helix domain-containing protein [Caproiciproducens sp. MSJ-32]|uniref:helix-hairpin-helix domain-containing protein n=1 Tax=Caproiciproducens sp. MSJ-32 TaxID=2841527 RepID=UPI001C10DA8E|nr:helix-hairpin-helix domain-containing protein [Caproiciproducens sp. MSJ-32]MBU5454473.1 helix-hairpin-helix domain-containing protein [Caproiciproducens sp. MSJ-32]